MDLCLVNCGRTMASTVVACKKKILTAVAPCLSNLTSERLHLYVPVHCLLERLIDSVRLSGLVSYLPSQGLDDGPVIILLGFSPIAIEQLVCLLWITLYNDSCIKIFV